MLCSHAVSRQGSPTAWLCGHCCQVACEVGIVVVVGRDDAKGPAMSALRPEADIWARLHHVCFGPIGDILLEVSTQFDLYLLFGGTSCRRSNIPVVRLCHRWLLQSPVRLPAPSPQPQDPFPPARRKTAPVRFSPQQVQTPSFTAPKMAILFPTSRRRGGKATLGSQNTVSAHSLISITSIQRGSSGEL